MPSQPPKSGSNRSKVRGYNIAVEFVAAVIGMALLGWLIDTWLDSLPIGLLVGLGIGLMGGMVNLIRQGIALNRAMEAERRQTKPHYSAESVKEEKMRDDLFHREIPEEDEDVRFPPGFDD